MDWHGFWHVVLFVGDRTHILLIVGVIKEMWEKTLQLFDTKGLRKRRQRLLEGGGRQWRKSGQESLALICCHYGFARSVNVVCGTHPPRNSRHSHESCQQWPWGGRCHSLSKCQAIQGVVRSFWDNCHLWFQQLVGLLRDGLCLAWLQCQKTVQWGFVFILLWSHAFTISFWRC